MPELHDSITEPERASTASPTLPRMTEEEFEAWCSEDVRAEWVDGEVVVMSPSNTRHGLIEIFLLRVVCDFVERRDLGQILASTIQVRFAKQRRRRLPDMLFVSKERAEIVCPTYLDGAPDLIMEIVSPESTERDWREKYLEYQSAGVREYWVIDPQAEQVAGYTLAADGAYQRIQERDGRVESVLLPGFFLRPAWLWQPKLPKLHEVLGEMGV